MTQAIPFVAFVETVLRVRLSPAQRVLATVAFDRVEPADLPDNDRALARQLFGPVDTIPESARAVLSAVVGARSGKSYIISACYSLWRALTADLSGLAPGEMAAAVIVAPDKGLARQVLRYALGAAKAAPSIARLVTSETSESFELTRPDGGRVSIEVAAASRGGSAARGRSLVCAVLDECAFFRDSDYQVNDTDVFRAVAPRILPGGLVIVASTPWLESGLLHDLHQRNHGKPQDALAVHAPTCLMRADSPSILAMVDRERARDPENASREFDAEFLTGGAGLFFDGKAISSAVEPQTIITSTARVGAGADFAFARDCSALAIVAGDTDVLRVAELIEHRPAKGQPLKPSAVVADFARAMKGYDTRVLASDIHYRESIREHLVEHEIALESAPPGQAGKVETYTRVLALLAEGRLYLPNHQRLIGQLRAVVARPTPGGGLSITSPRTQAGHGDLVSALVLAVWQAEHVPPPIPLQPSFTPMRWADMPGRGF